MKPNASSKRRGVLSRALSYFQPSRKASAGAYPVYQSLLQSPGKPVWSPREYGRFADEAYVRNVIAHRAITMIAQGASSVPFLLYAGKGDNRQELADHPALSLIRKPNPCMNGAQFLENLITYRMISGNAFVLAVGPAGQPPLELHLLRPDRVKVVAGKGGLPMGYQYETDEKIHYYSVHPVTGRSEILHLKTFHPLNDWYGLSPIEAAAYSIDQHNQAGQWNQALLQNGARPSGALIVNTPDGANALSEDQYRRLKTQMDDQFMGAANAGRPLLLEGGLEWKEMSLNPKDMDFLNTKHSAARDIALALGVPPQMLGIPGDNTYANLAEARLGLWEQTILPLLENITGSFTNWLMPMFGGNLSLDYDTDEISALSVRREKIWDRVGNADFLTNNEKREAVGYSPLSE